MKWGESVRSGARRCGALPEDKLSPELAVILAAIQRADGYAAERLLDLATSIPLHGCAPPAGDAGLSGSQRILLLKPVSDACNLACRYCYEKDRRGGSKHKAMTLQTLDAVLDNVLPFVRLPYAVYVHGGEPLLAGRGFFEHLVSKVRSRSDGDQIVLGVQTNGTLLDREWIDFFARHHFRIGLSLDGPPRIHDRYRIGPDGAGSYDRVIRGVRLVQERALPFGIICLITGSDAGRPGTAGEVFDHFVGLGVRDFDVHPAYTPIQGSAEYNVSPGDYASFMIELFDRWVANGDPEVRVRSIEFFFQSMARVHAAACGRAGACTTILGVEPEGLAAPCTRPFSAAYRFGDLSQIPLPDLLASLPFQGFSRDEARGREATGGCRWAPVCGWGGCPHERVADGRQAVDGRHVYCTCHQGGGGGFPAVFEHMEHRVQEVLQDASESFSVSYP